MDFEHTLTAADVKIRTTNICYIGAALGAGWPEHPFIAEEYDYLDANGEPACIATLATGRKVDSPAEITLQDVAHYLTDVVGLDGGVEVLLGGTEHEAAVVVFIDAAIAQRIHETHLAMTYEGPNVDLVVPRRHPDDARVAFDAFDRWNGYEPDDHGEDNPFAAATTDGLAEFMDALQSGLNEGPDDDEDPYDYPCQDCGAEIGEECHPYCTATPAANHLEPLTVTVIDVTGGHRGHRGHRPEHPHPEPPGLTRRPLSTVPPVTA